MSKKNKNLHDFLKNKEQTVPVQAKLPKSLVDKTKKLLAQNESTMTDLIEASLKLYVTECEERK